MESIILMAMALLIICYTIVARFRKAELRIDLCINNGNILIDDEFNTQSIRIADGLDDQSIKKIKVELAFYSVYLRNGFKSDLRSVVFETKE